LFRTHLQSQVVYLWGLKLNAYQNFDGYILGIINFNYALKDGKEIRVWYRLDKKNMRILIDKF
jgi:hypothetical protein